MRCLGGGRGFEVGPYLLRKSHPVLEERLRKVPVEAVCISAITRAELRFGVARRPGAVRLAQEVERFLQGIHVAPWDEAAADAYGIVRAELEARGTPIGSMDTLIAAHALVMDVRLISNNLREFFRVPGLRVEDWTQA